MFQPRRPTKVRPSVIAVAIVFAIYLFFFAFRVDSDDDRVGKIRYNLVVASTTSDDTSWLFQYFPNWHKSIYVVNDETAELTVEKNKGRESMVYLTYGPLPHVPYCTNKANFALTWS